MATPFLSLVVPSYRQASTIADELHGLHRLLDELVPSHEIILVIDGNSDHTLEAVRRAVKLPNLKVACFVHNQGKGMALKYGLLQARGQLVAFIDAGGDLDPALLEIMLVEMKLHQADIVIGSKRHSLSEVSYPPIRRLYSSTYQLLNRVLFHLRIRDTQVGLKLFRRQVLELVLPRVLVKQFAFDLELLVVAYHLGFKRIVEAPVRLQHNFASSIGWRAVVQTLWDTLAIFYRLRIRHWYDHQPAMAVPAIHSPVMLTVHQTTQLAGRPTALTLQPIAASKTSYTK